MNCEKFKTKSEKDDCVNLDLIILVYCNWTWDTILCWPPTEAGKTVTQKCPHGHGIDSTSKYFMQLFINK